MAHQYWRIYMVGNWGDTFTTGISELEMFDAAGTYLCTGGTASASGAYGANPPGNAFDHNSATEWAQPGVASTTTPYWLEYAMAAPVDVAVIRIFTNTAAQAPTSFKVQFSDDNVNWFDATGYYSLIIGGYSAPAFVVSLPPGGFYCNWRIRVTSATGGGGTFRAAEVAMKDTFGAGSLIVSSQYAMGVGIYSGFTPANLAFDFNNTTYSEYHNGGWIGYSFSRAYKIVEIDYLNDSPSGSWSNTSPIAFYLEGSNDGGVNWSTIQFFVAGPWTGPGQTQVFGITPDQRGNIAYNQTKVTDRQGLGKQFQMGGGGATIQGHSVIYDGAGNVISAGAQPMLYVATPPAHNSVGTPGFMAVDNSGNLYFCYAINAWARIGPGGYSSSF